MSNRNKDFLIEVDDLHVRFTTDIGIVKAVNGVSFRIKPGQSVGIVGESGCGKSVTSYSILRLLPTVGEITAGQINFKREDGKVQDLTQLAASGKEIRTIRGNEISMIFQEPMTAFSPVHTINNQIMESILQHQDISKAAAREKVIELLNLVGISNPEKKVDSYSFEFSGGMRQRAMIAMALACNPRLLIADEPTTALDVTIQAQVLELIKKAQRDFDLSLMLITHDLGVIAHMVEHVYVMYLGRVIEDGAVEQIFDNPKHPYTRDLLKSIPKLKGVTGKLSSIKGSVPDPYLKLKGCPFHTRCQDIVGNMCKEKMPRRKEMELDHFVNCYLYTDEGVDTDVRNAG